MNPFLRHLPWIDERYEDEDFSRQSLREAYFELMEKYPAHFAPRRNAEIESVYQRLTTLDQRLRDAREYPEATLRILFPPPPMRPRNEPSPLPGACLPEDLEVLLGPWRRALIEQILRE